MDLNLENLGEIQFSHPAPLNFGLQIPWRHI